VRFWGGHERGADTVANYTYLDGVRPFTSWEYGLWRSAIARRPCPQRLSSVCMGFGSCTVSIFPCPVPAFGLGGPFFCQKRGLTLTHVYYHFLTP
jgi:hypothetical protein